MIYAHALNQLFVESMQSAVNLMNEQFSQVNQVNHANQTSDKHVRFEPIPVQSEEKYASFMSICLCTT